MKGSLWDFAIPFFSLLPIPLLQPLLFLPYLFWTNLVALPLAMLGVPFFEVHEFGGVPQGVVGYGLICLVYLVLAFVLSGLRWHKD